MNCNRAREIINCAMDGEDHPLAAEAREHIRGCEACREWQADMSRVMDTIDACQDPPMPDISAMVMSRLPAAHPTSLRNRRDQRPLLQGLAWLAACWLMVICGAVLALEVSSHWLKIGSFWHAFSLGKTTAGGFGSVIVAVKAMVEVARSNAAVIARAVAPWGATLLAIAGIDIALLAAVVFAWRRRGATVTACMI